MHSVFYFKNFVAIDFRNPYFCSKGQKIGGDNTFVYPGARGSDKWGIICFPDGAGITSNNHIFNDGNRLFGESWFGNGS